MLLHYLAFACLIGMVVIGMGDFIRVEKKKKKKEKEK